MSGVTFKHIADHHPIKQHPQRRQVMFHGRLGQPRTVRRSSRTPARPSSPLLSHHSENRQAAL